MNDHIQRRFLNRKGEPIKLQERADGAPPRITGYAAVFYREGESGTEYEMWPGAIERIAPGAFDRATREDDVRALFNHDSDNVLGRLSAGTLRLSVDDRGLRYEIDPPDTQVARDLIQSIKRGDVTGSSFSFLPRGAAGTQKHADGDRMIYERVDLKLFDVGPVTFPAYASSLADSRGTGKPGGAEYEAAVAADLDAVAVALAMMTEDE